MAQSLAKILLHLVFSTKERQLFLRDSMLRDETHRYLGGILAHLDCQPLLVGGVEDHVHILFAHSRTLTVADVVKELKRESSSWLKTKSTGLSEFAWQSGYGVFSIGQSQVEDVRAYIAGQGEHHRKVSFQDEFRRLLIRYEVEFDESPEGHALRYDARGHLVDVPIVNARWPRPRCRTAGRARPCSCGRPRSWAPPGRCRARPSW